MTKLMKFAFLFSVLMGVACIQEQPDNLGECSGDMMDKTEWMAREAQANAEANAGKRAGRGARGVGRLLDDEDPNIGNGVDITATPNIIIKPITNPARILNLNGLSPLGGMVTVGISAKTQITGAGANFFTGPLIGMLEVGNGSVFFDKIEVDLNPGQVSDLSVPSSARDGVVFVTVPAGALRVYARHDGNLVTPSLNGNFGNPFAPLGGGLIGQTNLPRGSGPWLGPTFDVKPAFVKAFACYRPQFNTRNTRTVWVYNNQTTGVTITALTDSNYAIPPVAKRVRVYRVPVAGVGFTLRIVDQIGTMESFVVAAGTNSPVFDLPAGAISIGIDTTGDINSLALVFEVGF